MDHLYRLVVRRAAKAGVADEGEPVAMDARRLVPEEMARRGEPGDALPRDAEQPRLERLAVAVKMVCDLGVLDVLLENVAGLEARVHRRRAPTAKIVEPERVDRAHRGGVDEEAGRDVPIHVEAQHGVDRGVLDEFAIGFADGLLRLGDARFHLAVEEEGEHARVGVVAHVGRDAAALKGAGEVVGRLREGREEIVAENEDALRRGRFHAKALRRRWSHRCSRSVRRRACWPLANAASGSRRTISAAASSASSDSARTISFSE